MATDPQAQFVLDLIGKVRELTDILEREALRLNPRALSLVKNEDGQEDGDG